MHNIEQVDGEKLNRRLVDVTRLHEGMVVKNYKELCNLLGEDVTDGNSRDAQINRWSLYFKWEKEPRKHKYTITKIYSVPLPDVVPDNSTFAKMMQLILMRILGYMPDDTYYYFLNKFWVDTGMVNEEYKRIVISEEKLENYFGEGKKYSLIDPDTAKNFFDIAGEKLKEATNTALKALESAGLIHYRQEYCVKKHQWKRKGGFQSATKEEENLILEAEQHVLDKMGVTRKYFAMKNSGNYYRKEVNNYIHEKDKTIFGVAQWIVIVYHKPPQSHFDRVTEQIVKDLKKNGYMDSEEYIDNEILLYLSRIALNDLVINKMIQEAKKQHDRSIQKLTEEGIEMKVDKYNHKDYVVRSSNEFVSKCIYLVDTLIRLSENPRVIDYEEVDDEDYLEDDFADAAIELV